MTATATREYLCVNGKGKQAIPIPVASQVVRAWCDKNPQYAPGLDADSPQRGRRQRANDMTAQNTLASLAGIHVRLMYDIFHDKVRVGPKTKHGRPRNASVTTTISLDVMDRILVGMDCTELWYAPPLDLYYLPINEWTDEMRARHV